MLQTLALKRVLEVCSPLSLSMSDTKPNCFKRNGAAVLSFFTLRNVLSLVGKKIYNMVNKSLNAQTMALVTEVTGKWFLNGIFSSRIIIILLGFISMKDFVMWNHTTIQILAYEFIMSNSVQFINPTFPCWFQNPPRLFSLYTGQYRR